MIDSNYEILKFKDEGVNLNSVSYRNYCIEHILAVPKTFFVEQGSLENIPQKELVDLFLSNGASYCGKDAHVQTYVGKHTEERLEEDYSEEGVLQEDRKFENGELISRTLNPAMEPGNVTTFHDLDRSWVTIHSCGWQKDGEEIKAVSHSIPVKEYGDIDTIKLSFEDELNVKVISINYKNIVQTKAAEKLNKVINIILGTDTEELLEGYGELAGTILSAKETIELAKRSRKFQVE